MLSIKSENNFASFLFAGYVIDWKGMLCSDVVSPTPIRFLSNLFSFEFPFRGRSSP